MKRINVVVWMGGFPGQGMPDVDEWMTEEEALQRFGEPDSKTSTYWQYF